MTTRNAWARSAALGSIAVVGLGGVALAGPHGECGKGRPMKRLESRLENLGLDPQNLEKAQGLLEKAREERRASHDEMREAGKRLHELMLDENSDVDTVLAQVDAVASLKTSAKKEKVRTLLAIRELLTPEQWTQLLERPAGEKDHHRHKKHLF